MVAILLAIDPGAKSGFAVLGEDGSCIDSGSEPWVNLRPRLAAYHGISAVVVEMPYYRCDSGEGSLRTPGDPNQLIRLAWSACDHARQIAGSDATIYPVLPHDWKGRIEKLMHQRRFEKDHLPPGWATRWAGAGLDERDAIALLHWAATTKAGLVCK